MLRTPPLPLCVALVAVVALDVGCVLASPDFDGGSEATTATSASDSDAGTSGATTGASAGGSTGGSSAGDSGSASQGSTSATSTTTTGEPTTGEPTTGDMTTGDATTSGDMTTGDATTGEQTTGGVEPGTYDLDPTVAACVLQGNQNGPYTKQGCAMNASGQVGEPELMMHDTSVGQGGGVGRRAESYLSFAIPAQWAGATITSVKLRVQSADTPWVETPKAGELVETQSFTEGSLEASSPGVLGSLDANNTTVSGEDWVQWTVPPDLVVPGESLYLGIMPNDPIGVFLRKGTAALEVVIE